MLNAIKVVFGLVGGIIILLMAGSYVFNILYNADVKGMALMVMAVVATVIMAWKWLPAYGNHKKTYFMLFGLACVASLVIVVFGISEWKLRKHGNTPGVRYSNFYYQDTLRVFQCTASDERGMNYYTRLVPDVIASLNSQGFIADFEYDTVVARNFRLNGKKLVFIIGDSFTEGISDKGHYDSTFVERLRAQHPEWAIYNFGVGGTDPINYRLIAEKYVAGLRPDLVLIAFCSNDIMHYDIPATPGIPKYFDTNCGRLQSTVNLSLSRGEYILLNSAEEAYDYYTTHFTLLRLDDWVAKICRTSCVLTHLYFQAAELQSFSSDYSRMKRQLDDATAYRHLQKINDLCHKSGSGFVIAFIPNPRQVDNITSADAYHNIYGRYFNDLLPVVNFPIGIVTSRDYFTKGAKLRHFNDAGNGKYSMFLDSIISAQLQSRIGG